MYLRIFIYILCGFGRKWRNVNPLHPATLTCKVTTLIPALAILLCGHAHLRTAANFYVFLNFILFITTIIARRKRSHHIPFPFLDLSILCFKLSYD